MASPVSFCSSGDILSASKMIPVFAAHVFYHISPGRVEPTAGGLLIGVLAASLVMFMGRKKKEQE